VTGSVTGWPAALRVSSKAKAVTASQVMPIAQAPRTSDRVHAEQDPADPDQRDERDDHGDEGGPPPAAGGGQEDEQDRPIADERAE
jgi:hypothetical protein